MQMKDWTHIRRRILVCVDSYKRGVLSGRFYNDYLEEDTFERLSQFLIKTECCLNDLCKPQAYTIPRTFSAPEDPPTVLKPVSVSRRGALATFELVVIFRQNTSWQGIIKWRENRMEQSFRSVLELVMLIDSALRSTAKA